MRSSVAPIVVVVVAVVGNLLTAGAGAADVVAPAVTSVAREPVSRDPEPASGTITRATAPGVVVPADHTHELQLPDGTYVPALNDAVDAAPLKDYWGPFPWSPIVGVERNSVGLDWYRHADGSYSTTQMVWRSDLGRSAAMTRVAHPGPAEVPAAGGGAPR